jgi:DNA-directed RNA polymerase omega subunit
MIYANLEKIYKMSNIENKYALAMIVSTRARQLSEQKGRQLDGDGSERYITYAIEEIEDDKLIIGSTVVRKEAESDDVPEVGGR